MATKPKNVITAADVKAATQAAVEAALAEQAEAHSLELAAARAPEHAPNGDFNFGVGITRLEADGGGVQPLGVLTVSCLTYSKARGLSGLLATANNDFHGEAAVPAEDIMALLSRVVFTPQQAAGRDERDVNYYDAAPKRAFDKKGADEDMGANATNGSQFRSNTTPASRA